MSLVILIQGWVRLPAKYNLLLKLGGAVGAREAHNLKVDRSKLSSAIKQYLRSVRIVVSTSACGADNLGSNPRQIIYLTGV